MNKNKKVFKPITMKFDSKEELYFSWFIKELVEAGYIYLYTKITDSYQLTNGLTWNYIKPMKKVPDKLLKQTILKPSVYTPDFKIQWTEKALGIFVTELIDNKDKKKITTPFICQNMVSIIEIKGNFDSNNMSRLAINNIKFLYEKYGLYVNLIKIPGIFNKTFTPIRYLNTDKSNKTRKINYKNIGTLRTFIDKISK